MKALITRNMNVVNDDGENEQFTKGKKPVEISDTVFDRLRRAGAAVPYDGSETGEDDEEVVTAADAIVAEVGGPIANPVTGTDVAPTDGVTHDEQLSGAPLPSEDDLKGMTKPDVVAAAKREGVTVEADDTKAEIIKNVLDARSK